MTDLSSCNSLSPTGGIGPGEKDTSVKASSIRAALSAWYVQVILHK